MPIKRTCSHWKVRGEDLEKELWGQSDCRHRSPHKNTPIPYQCLDADGCILEVNQVWLDVLGYTHKEVTGKPFCQYLHPSWVEYFNKCLAGLKSSGRSSHIELKVLRRSGSSLHVTLHGRTEEGREPSSRRIHCLLHDGSRHDHLENHRKELLDVWAFSFDAIDDFVTIQDESQRIIRANKAAQDLLKSTNGPLVGRHCYEVLTGRPEPCNWCPLVTGNKDGPRQISTISHEKQKKVFQVSSTVMSGENGRTYLVHVGRDVTEGTQWLKPPPQSNERSNDVVELTGKDKMSSDIAERLEMERILRESEQKFSLAFEASPDSVNINRLADGMYVDVNKGFTKLTGYTGEDVRGRTSLEINIWHDPGEGQKLIESLTKKGCCENLEAKFRRKDGSVTYGLMSARIITLNNEPHIISITRDISDLKRVEQENIAQKMLFETMFNTVGDGIVVTDTNGIIRLANKGMQATFGYVPEELVGKSTEGLHMEQDMYQAVGNKVPGPEPALKESLYVATYRHKSGREFPGETFKAKLYDHDKKWIGGLGIMRDISQRQKIEAERERLIAAIEQASEIVVITDRQGSIVYVNLAFEKITGYCEGEVIGENPRILKSGKHDKNFYQAIWKTITGGKTFNGRIVNKRKNGTLYTVEATISPVCTADGKVVSYVAVNRDITDQILLEEQLQQAQKMESVGRLTGGVAHDFNNILGIIIGSAEMALDQVEPGQKLGDHIETILEAANRSAEIVHQLLAFSRQQTIDPKILDLNNVVEGMLKMLRRLIGEDIELAWNPRPGLLPVRMDPTQVNQILANLCVNARDAIGSNGRITIETDMVVFDEKYCMEHNGFQVGEFVRLAISDDGSGMSKEEQSKIFEPFFTTKEPGSGTGLGLSTVYGIVKQNSGFINVYSERDQGTTFKIYFSPCVDEMAETEKVMSVEKPAQGSEVVLLVEDDPVLLQMARQMLELNGYTILAANSAGKACALAETNIGSIDLLLTDVVLPEVNGVKLAEIIKLTHPNIKVLFMSGYTANAIVQKGVLEKNINFIQKPFSRKQLSAKIRQVLDGQ